MTDPDLVEKKLAFIEAFVAELRRLARPAEIERDVREECFVAHTLQVTIQAALDMASPIVSDDRPGEPENDRALFEPWVRTGRLPATPVPTLSAMVGLRNILGHGHQAVGARIARAVLEPRLDHLTGFAAAIRAGLPRGPDA
jgi:uncharacterized protein YutE (UPF0331/DUF86 family)